MRARCPSVVILVCLACGLAAADAWERSELPSGLTAVIAELHAAPIVELRLFVRVEVPADQRALADAVVRTVAARLIASPALARAGGVECRSGPDGPVFAVSSTSEAVGTTLAALFAGLADPIPATTAIPPPDPAADLDEDLRGLLFRRTSHRLPLAGTTTSTAPTPAAVATFHANAWKAGAMTLVACGNLLPAAFHRQLALATQALPPGSGATQAMRPEPLQRTPRSLVSERGSPGPVQAIIAWTVPPAAAETLDDLASLAVIAELLEARLLPAASAGIPLAEPPHAELVPGIAHPGWLNVSLRGTADARADAKRAILTLIDRLATESQPAGEVTGAARSLAMRLSARGGDPSLAADDLLFWEHAAADPGLVLAWRSAVAAVDAKRIQQVAGRLLSPGRVATLVRRPAEAAGAPGSVSDPGDAPPPITTAELRPEVVDLPGGAHLLWRPAAGGIATVAVVLGGGAANEDPAAPGATEALALLIAGSQGADDPLAVRGIRIHGEAGADRLVWWASCVSEDAGLVAAHLLQRIARGVVAEDALAQVRLRLADAAGADPLALASNELRHQLFAGHYAEHGTISADEALRLDSPNLTAHLRRLAVAGNLVVAASGVPRDATAEHLRETLLGLPEIVPGPPGPARGLAWPAERIPQTATVWSASASAGGSAVALGWPLGDLKEQPDDLAAALVVAELAAGHAARVLGTTGSRPVVQAMVEVTDRRTALLLTIRLGEARQDPVQAVANALAAMAGRLAAAAEAVPLAADEELMAARDRVRVRLARGQLDEAGRLADQAVELLAGGDPASAGLGRLRIGAVGVRAAARAAAAFANEPWVANVRPMESRNGPALPVPSIPPGSRP